MTRRTHFVPAALALAILLFVLGCGITIGPGVVGSGVVKTESRSTGEFTSVQNNISANVDITVGPATQIVVEGDDNILPLITTDVHNGVLVISSNASIQTRSALKVTITTPELRGLVINGSGDASIRGLSGGSFDGAINGSGNVTATGKVDKLIGRINGSGNLDFDELTADSAAIAIAGSGRACVAATSSLDASITGSGDIAYRPASELNLRKQIVGSGSIRPI